MASSKTDSSRCSLCTSNAQTHSPPLVPHLLLALAPDTHRYRARPASAFEVLELLLRPREEAHRDARLPAIAVLTSVHAEPLVRKRIVYRDLVREVPSELGYDLIARLYVAACASVAISFDGGDLELRFRGRLRGE